MKFAHSAIAAALLTTPLAAQPQSTAGAYVGTDLSNRDAADLHPGFSKGQDGIGNIAGGTVVASPVAVF